jgi:hypothetical protein
VKSTQLLSIVLSLILVFGVSAGSVHAETDDGHDLDELVNSYCELDTKQQQIDFFNDNESLWQVEDNLGSYCEMSESDREDALEEYDIKTRDDDENESKQSKKDEKQAKAQEKRDEKQARSAEKFAEREAKQTEKAQFSQERANKIIEELEQKIQKMEERLQKLLEKYASGKYFGNLKNKDTVTNSFTLSFDGTASEISDSSNIQTLNGQLFLENQVTGEHTKKFRVTSGEISIGEDEIYDIVFGKARLSSSGHGGQKDSMVVIAQTSNTGDIRTLKLSINLSEEFNSEIESSDIEILFPQSKIASQWFLSGTGNLELTESEEQTETTQDTADTSDTGDVEDDTEIEIPSEDIPISTTLTVSIPSDVYFSGDEIIISGTVTDVFEGIPIILQTVTGSDRVDIAQIDVSSDGAFTHTILANGPLWVTDTYTIKAFYGANNSVETTFEFTASS